MNDLRCQLTDRMMQVFGDDRRRIDHALEVLGYADQIRACDGGDETVVTASAILHDIGIQAAERKHGSSAGVYQEIEGPAIAEPILRCLGLDEPRLTQICRIIGSHHTCRDCRIAATPEFRVLWDADRIANIPEETAGKTSAQLHRYVELAFRTAAGRQMGRQRLLGQTSNPPEVPDAR